MADLHDNSDAPFPPRNAWVARNFERRDDVGCRVLPDSPDPVGAVLAGNSTPADAIPFSSAGAFSASTDRGSR